MASQWVADPRLQIINHDFSGGRAWWNTVLTLDEKSRLDQLMGAALLEAGIAERLLHHDETLIDPFKFSPLLRQWLLQTEAASIQEFAQIIVDKLKVQSRFITAYGDSSIIITSEEVKQAANLSLLSLKPNTEHPLQGLKLVDEYIENPYLPTSQLNRHLALQHLLARIITSEFKQHCWIFDIPSPAEVSSREDACNHIRLVADKRGPRLMGWSWLYYHYVCVDLDISADLFAQMLYVDRRTLRRYQQAAFHYLAEKLVILEGQARLRAHTTSLGDPPTLITVLF